MNYRQMIGHRLVMGLNGTQINQEFEDLVKDYQIGNVILFKENVVSNDQLKKLCGQIQSLVQKHTGYPALITIDQEGGMVTRLEADGLNVPGAMAISATKDPHNAYVAGKITGLQLGALGINIDLAPVADINSNMQNPVIGVRSYGDDKDRVSLYAKAMAQGLADSGLLAVAKHFPGHGDTNVDSHLGLPEINKSLADLYDCELVPFINLIAAKVPAIMTSHILFPQLEPDRLPATMSRKIITGLLKDKLGFQGLVISDCMEMKAIENYYGTVAGVVKAIQAGVDLILISHTHDLVRRAADQVLKAMEDGQINMAEFEASVAKIIAVKAGLKGRNQAVDLAYDQNQARIEALLEASLSPLNFSGEDLPELGNKPLFVACKPFRATNVMNAKLGDLNFADYMARVFGGVGVTIDHNPDTDQVRQLLANSGHMTYSAIVIGTYNAHLYEGQKAVIDYLADKARTLIVIALRNPYDLIGLPDGAYGIAAYEYSHKSLKAIGRALKKDFIMTGQLPVQL